MKSKEEMLDILVRFHRGELMIWLWHIFDGDETAQLQDIADTCGMCRKTASRAMISLEEKGVIWVDRDEIGRRRTSGLKEGFALAPETEGVTLIPNLYVSSKAPPEVIKAVYRALSRLYHPDRNQGREGETTEKMREVIESFKGWQAGKA